MHDLKKIKDEMVKKIEDTYKDHPDLSPSVLDYVDKLAHAAKNIHKLCEADDGEYSMRGMPFVYGGESYGGEAYARGRMNAKRDSMGRYSREDGYSRGTWDTVNKIEDLIREAPDEQTRQELQRIAGRMRNG